MLHTNKVIKQVLVLYYRLRTLTFISFLQHWFQTLKKNKLICVSQQFKSSSKLLKHYIVTRQIFLTQNFYFILSIMYIFRITGSQQVSWFKVFKV